MKEQKIREIVKDEIFKIVIGKMMYYESLNNKQHKELIEMVKQLTERMKSLEERIK